MLYISWEHVPSAIKNPEVKSMEVEIKVNPYKDYSNIIYNMSSINSNSELEYFNKNLLEYNKSDTEDKDID